MALFCKKTFSSRSPLPVSFTNALRPDSPLRQFREQQNSSENSESTEETESAKKTEALVSEPREPVPANRPALIHSYVMEIRQGRQECLPCLNACRYHSLPTESNDVQNGPSKFITIYIINLL